VAPIPRWAATPTINSNNSLIGLIRLLAENSLLWQLNLGPQ
jgi:hypothetical protein